MKWIVACCVSALLAGLLTVTAGSLAETSIVSGSVALLRSNGTARSDNDTGIVVWLTPVPNQARASRDRSGDVRPRIVQRNKRFETRLLAVEVGTTVDFPNQDPFFHNVFSRFDGKQFDLGLYEAGATKSVRFNTAGVCYIFCNIHSQMSAVVVVVETPYFIRLNAPGEFRISELPFGRYQLNVWAGRCSPETLKAASRQVTVDGARTNIGVITLKESRDLMTGHSNKYGKDYETPVFSSPLYTLP
jgi:plastocyanin